MAECSKRWIQLAMKASLFTETLNLLKPSSEKRYRTSLCNLFLLRYLGSPTSQNRASLSRLNLKIFAVPYLGYNSSKFSPKPLVEKVVSRTVCCRHFQSAASVGPQTSLNFTTRGELEVSPKPMSPGNSQKSSGVVHCVTDCMWMSRNSMSVISWWFLAMLGKN